MEARTTCDWCLQQAPVQVIKEDLWRFWGIISAEDPVIAPLKNICLRCKACYEGFSFYIETCKSNEAIIEKVLSSERTEWSTSIEEVTEEETIDPNDRNAHAVRTEYETEHAKVLYDHIFSASKVHPWIRSVEKLPEKSKKRYTATYNGFKKWRKSNNAPSPSEEALTAYFTELAETASSPTLWAKYSMLKTCLKAYDDVDIASYVKVIELLKRKNLGYQRKKRRTLTAADISRFCAEAPDREFLVVKAVLVIGIVGACRREELTSLTVNDVEDHGTMLLVKVPKTETGVERSFVVVEEFYGICKRYLQVRMRVKRVDRFFLRMFKGKCTNQPIGVNKIGSVPKEIATFLNLPEPESYTGHCFRRTSATLFLPPRVRMLSSPELE